MPSWLPSTEYPLTAKKGYWAPITSTINWCEEVCHSPRLFYGPFQMLIAPQDYYVTFYLAEIVNTLTNLVFVYLAYRGFQSCIKHGHDTIFWVSFVGYLLVGMGSFLFHATLKCMFPNHHTNEKEVCPAPGGGGGEKVSSHF